MVINTDSKEPKDVILLIHPFLSSAEEMKTGLADFFPEPYHFIIPDLNGHGKASERPYSDARTEAEEIHAYLLKKNCDHLRGAFAASLGTVVLFELLHYSDITIDRIFMEGANFYEHAPMAEFMLQRALTEAPDPAAEERRLQTLTMLYGQRAEVMADRLKLMPRDSLLHIIHDCSFVDLPALSPEQQKNCVFAYGERDTDLLQCRKIQPQRYPLAQTLVWPGYGHCSFMTSEPRSYACLLERFFCIQNM